MKIISQQKISDLEYPPGLMRLTDQSRFDDIEDWALFLPGDKNKNTIIYLHGSFADGARIFTRPDVRDHWLSRIIRGSHPLLTFF